MCEKNVYFDCTTFKTFIIIYCIHCSHCNQLDIEEIGCRLGDRMRDHLNDIHKKDISKPGSRHFNSSNHSMYNFVEFDLSVISGGNDCHKIKVIRLIHTL